EIEAAMKEGRLPAVCATASLELGIDMGAVELVCQVARPGNVARALQRVGRAGHLVGQKSKGRFIPRMASDLLEQAVLGREMRVGHVEPIEVPVNCLDVLAQQIVAMTAMEDWSVPDLYARIRQAYPYRDLSPQVFETTLEMVSGRYRFLPEEGPSRARLSSLEALQPRVSWDRVHNRLAALPGSQSLALLHGGTIPDTGQYAAYLANGTRLGELDEEFIFERRVGDTFLLGTNAWKLDRIEPDRVIVVPAEGAPAIVPFWRGEGQGRSHGLGQAIGAFLREAEHRLTDDDFTDWLMRDFALDRRAAQSLHLYLQRQILTVGCLPSDQTLVVEASRDQLGDWQVILLSPLGQRPHLALRFALEGALRERLGYHPQCLHHDDGVLIRLTDSEEPVLDLLTGISEDNVEELILRELADSALFAIRFRQNAARSLLMPRGKAGQRAPLWLQRLRGRDLLQVARRHPDFPVVVETYRECLRDYLDVPKVQELLREVREGRIRLVTRRLDQPSPFASTLLFSFTAANMYQYDQVEPEGESAQHLDRDALAQMIRPEDQEHLLDPRAIHQVERRLRGMGHPPRSETEMAEWLRRLGDLGPDDLHGPMDTFLDALTRNGVAREIHLPGVPVGQRWILAEEEPIYQQAFFASSAPGETRQQAASRILLRFLETHALVALDDVLRRYPFDRDWVNRQLEGWLRQGRAVAVGPHRSAEARFSSPENLDHIQRSSLGLLRREVIPCQPTQFQVFLQQWQKVYPGCQRTGPQRLLQTLEQMQGFFLPVEIWERAVLPARMQAFQSRELGDWIAGGGGVWIGRGQGERGVEEITFLPRNLMTEMGPPTLAESSTPAVDRVAAFLEQRGASFLTDLALDSGLSPGETRRALWALVRAGRVSNDQFDVVRRGEPEDVAEVLSSRGPTSRTLRSLRRAASQQTEGRWSLLRWGRPTPEQLALTQCHLGLQWFGVLTRELALLAGWLLPWRILYEVLSRLELAGEVRRGYFIEGMSGAQFALPEVVELLQQQHLPAN
ncbi:MAG: helicase-related protein, partial [Gemmataceae bacterium]